MIRFIFLFLVLISSIIYADNEIVLHSNKKNIIKNSLNDGFYVLAEKKCRDILTKIPNSEKKDYYFYLIHSLYAQGKYDEVLAIVSDLKKGDQLTYWKSKTLMSLGRNNEALNILKGDQSKGLLSPERMHLKSVLLYDSKDYNKSNEILINFKKKYPNHPKNFEVDYQLALNYLALKNINQAETIFTNLIESEDREISVQAKIIYASILKDYKNNNNKSKRLLDEVYESQIVQINHKIKSLKLLVNIFLEEKDLPTAIVYLEDSIKWLPSKDRFDMKKKLIDLCMTEQLFDEALRWIDAARTEEISHKEAVSLQFKKSEILIELNRFNDAAFSYQIILDVVYDPYHTSLAYYGRGNALWNLDRFNESANMFHKAYTITTDKILKIQSLLKAGDSYYASEQYLKSEELYLEFLNNFENHKLVPQALYQLGLSVARIGRRSEASEIFKSICSDFPQSEFTTKAMLRLSDIFIADQKWNDAINMYIKIENISNKTNEIALSKNQRGLLLYNLGNYEEAKNIFDDIINSYKNSDYYLQANYLRGFCLYMLNDVEKSLEICNNFVNQYPNSIWTADVLFWLGEQAYNSENYKKSEIFFRKIYDFHSSHKLSEQSLLMICKSLIKLKQHKEALEYLSLFIRTYPSSLLIAEVRFYQGDVLSELGEYSRAILAFEEIIKKFPEHNLVNNSIGRIGDCQFSLAINQKSRYDDALSKYNTLIQKQTLSDDLLMQCLYKSGRCEFKKGNYDNAFEYYVSAVYHFFDKFVLKTSENVMWFTRSAFAAAELQENLGNIKGAIAIYERIINAEVNSSEEAKKRRDILQKKIIIKN